MDFVKVSRQEKGKKGRKKIHDESLDQAKKQSRKKISKPFTIKLKHFAIHLKS